MNTTTLKIIAIDSNDSSINAYIDHFQSYDSYTLAGIYRTVEAALEDYDRVAPDIIISEVSLEGRSGIDGIRLLKAKDPDVKIIMVSNQNDFEVIKTAFKNQANGYMTKPINKERLLNALHSVKKDGAVLSSDIARKLIAMFQQKTYPFLSDRENEIIEYLSQGATYKAMAEKLFVTTSTVNFHLQNIYLKLDVNSKSEALEKLRALDYAS